MSRAILHILVGLLLWSGCSAGDGDPEASLTPTVTPEPPVNLAGPFPYARLSDYRLFSGELAALTPRADVLPYDVISPLYSDHAVKPRFLALPPDGAIAFSLDAPWGFPEKTLLVKNFLFPDDMRDPEAGRTLIETRLLILENGLWTAHTYRWNADQTDAELLVAGASFMVSYIGEQGEPVEQMYQIPNNNQCKNCHGNNDRVTPIGPRTRQLNREVEQNGATVGQIEWLAAQGAFSEGLPEVALMPALSDPYGSDTLEHRARSYLEANCAHCHQAGGAAGASGLVLTTDESDPYNFGVCRKPVATGPASGTAPYDITPRAPAESILVHRMASTDPEIKMPELGTSTVDERGLALVESWIEAMTYADCD